MKKVVLIVSFGTSHEDARGRSLNMIEKELTERLEKIPVLQAYTSGMIIRKLAAQGIKIFTVEDAFKEALLMGAEEIYAVSTHMIPGKEYHKMLKLFSDCAGRYQFDTNNMRFTAPVLSKKEDCSGLIPVLQGMLGFREEYEYILMGHGTEAAADKRYGQMKEALAGAGLENVQIASLEGRPDMEDVVKLLRKRKVMKKVLLHPLMVVAGDHARNDMAGNKDSFLSRLRTEGFETEAVVKGLGEYSLFRNIYAERLMKLMR